MGAMMLSQREAFARVCEHLVTHDGYPGHCYSQYSRLGDGTTEAVDLGDGVTVTIAGGDRDCSSMVVTALKAVGVDVRGASYTGNLMNICDTGLFAAHRRSNGRCVDGYSARRGDIYLNVTHHTAVCRYGAYEEGGDVLMQFSGSELGTIDGAEGDQTGRESNIKPFYEYPWDYTLSWTSDGAMIGKDTDMTNDQAAKLDAIYAEVTRRDDVSGRGFSMTTHEQLNFMAGDLKATMTEVLRRDDCSDREDKQEMTTHEHVKWLAAEFKQMDERQQRMDEKLDAIIAKLGE